jgi:hypothetical protein
MISILKNLKIRVWSLGIVLAGMISAGIFMQSCSSDVSESLSDESNTNAKHLETINSIRSQDLQTVLETVFQTVEEKEGGCDIYNKVNVYAKQC